MDFPLLFAFMSVRKRSQENSRLLFQSNVLISQEIWNKLVWSNRKVLFLGRVTRQVTVPPIRSSLFSVTSRTYSWGWAVNSEKR